MTNRPPLTPIRDDADHARALALAETWFDRDVEPSADSEDGAFFDALITLIDAYEARRFTLPAGDPVDAIRFTMEQRGLDVGDLVPMIGARHRVYEILNRRRPLTLAMIRRLHAGLGIPAERLIAAPHAA